MATDRAGEPLVPPERPAAMDNDDEAGAQAAAEYFIELYGYATRSQDLEEFTAFCDPESTFCDGVIDAVNADIAAGTQTTGGASTLHAYRIDVPSAEKFYSVWGRVDREPFDVHGADGTVIYESEGEHGLDFAVAVEHLPGDGWIVRAAKAGIVPNS